MTDLLATLNEAQRSAVTAPDGPVLVVAGAGSGKTRVLTTRIAHLLRDRGVLPSEVLAFTFTNRAAGQMKERVDGLVGTASAPHWIGTFHATGVKILRRDGKAIGIDPNFSIYDSDDSLRLIKRVMGDLKIDVKTFPPKQVRAKISAFKSQDIGPEAAVEQAGDFRDEKIAAAYAAYEDGLRNGNSLDFDDLILRTVHLLERSPEALAKYSERFRHVLVDEFQDTNPLQLVLVKALSSHHRNIFAVGDDDQSIYSWRGACIENMLRFEEYFAGTTLVRLEQNYRSTGNILDAANAVIAHNTMRKGKNLWTTGEAGDRLRCEQVVDEEDEAARVVEIVREQTAAGLNRGDVTVLYRTNAQSRVLEDSLRRSSLPYQIVGATAFYERREVRDVMAYLKLVNNPRDAVAALRVMNVPKRRIGDATIGHLSDLAAEHDLSLGEAAVRPGLLEQRLAPAACSRVRDFFGMVAGWRATAPETSVPKLIETIVDRIGYAGYLERDEPEKADERNENVNELITGAYAFDEQSDGGSLGQYLEQVALVADADTIGDEQGVVRLMTIHAAKGLEFPVVVLVGCEEELIPHVSNLDDPVALEEERRLFYVALTRAEKRAYLLHARGRRRFGERMLCLTSRFLGEIPDDVVERVGEADTAGANVKNLLGDASARPSLFTGDVPRRGSGGLDRGRGRSRGGRPERAPRPSGASIFADDISQEEVSFRVGQSVLHSRFGRGVVARVEGGGENLQVTVDFPGGMRKQFLARFANLRPAD